jgi:hypothetical protein
MNGMLELGLRSARAALAALLACLAQSAAAQPPAPAPPAAVTAPTEPAPAAIPAPTEPAPAATPAAAPAQAPAPPVLKPFNARYKVEAFGFSAGTADIILKNGTAGHYEYSTALHPRGLFRLVVPSNATLATSAEAEGTSVRPLRYREEDGTESTSDDVTLDFDWTHGIVQGVAQDEPVRLALPANTQDPMSIQLAVLLDFANKREPVRYPMVDKTQIKVYEYKSEGPARLETALGPLDTVIYSSNRPGQPNRLTRVWYAPALDYTPVRSEDINDGKLRIRMTILSLKR